MAKARRTAASKNTVRTPEQADALHSHKNVTIAIGEAFHVFDFEYIEASDKFHLCTITCEGQYLVVNKNFDVVSTNMSDQWIAAALQQLAVLLAER